MAPLIDFAEADFIVGDDSAFSTASRGHQSRFFAAWCQPLGHSSQVLRCCGQYELVLRTYQAPQAQPVELENTLEVSEQHFNFLALFAGMLVCIRLSNLAGHVTRTLMNAARDLAMRRVWATL